MREWNQESDLILIFPSKSASERLKCKFWVDGGIICVRFFSLKKMFSFHFEFKTDSLKECECVCFVFFLFGNLPRRYFVALGIDTFDCRSGMLMETDSRCGVRIHSACWCARNRCFDRRIDSWYARRERLYGICWTVGFLCGTGGTCQTRLCRCR